MPGSNPDVNLSNLPGVWTMLQEKTGVFEVPFVPAMFTAPFASANAGIAGLMLVFSIFFSGNRIGLFRCRRPWSWCSGRAGAGSRTAERTPGQSGGRRRTAAPGFLIGRLPTQ
jgi:hypothetical protein